MAHDDRQNPNFQTTHWSVVVAAGKSQSAESNAALSQLCERYWYPLYVFARKKTGDNHRAQDLLQAFFAQLLEKKFVGHADQTQGKFRTFLITALSRFMNNQWNREQTIKRGGGLNKLSIDLESGERRYLQAPSHSVTAEALFDRQWALQLLDQVVNRLRNEYHHDGKLDQFDQLKPTIVADETKLPYSQVAAKLKTSEANVKVLVHRLRHRYRQILCEEISQTLCDNEEIDAEIAQLFDVFAS